MNADAAANTDASICFAFAIPLADGAGSLVHRTGSRDDTRRRSLKRQLNVMLKLQLNLGLSPGAERVFQACAGGARGIK
eukprot:8939803-Alexandrium_andersonii.AAC.1